MESSRWNYEQRVNKLVVRDELSSMEGGLGGCGEEVSGTDVTVWNRLSDTGCRSDKWGHLDPKCVTKVDSEPVEVVELGGQVHFLVADLTQSVP